MDADYSSKPISTNFWLDQLEVAKSSPDSLGRESFARTLADAIVQMPNDRSVVTAVFGPWGCGKTWLLERIVRSLEEDHPAAIEICRFSPWELKSHEQILGEFFQTVAAKIPPKDETRNLAKKETRKSCRRRPPRTDAASKTCT
jgi:predicted KAP-like P-loop ATPase